MNLNHSTELGSLHNTLGHPLDSNGNEPTDSNVGNSPRNRSERAKEAITSLSWISGYKSLTATRCNSWDDRELDALEGFKFIGFVLIQLLCTTMYINIAPQFDVWKAVDFLREIFFTIIINCN